MKLINLEIIFKCKVQKVKCKNFLCLKDADGLEKMGTNGFTF